MRDGVPIDQESEDRAHALPNERLRLHVHARYGTPRPADALHAHFSMVAHFIFPGTHLPPRQNPSVTPSQGSTHHQADMSITTPSRDDATLGADQHQFSTTSAAITLPKWGGTPIRASLFLRDIGEYAAQRSFLSLLLCDYYVSKNMIIAANADVVARVKEHFNNPIANPLPDDIQHPNLNPRVPSSDCTYNLRDRRR